MNLLALETSTERLSVGVLRDGSTWLHEGAGGAQASAGLIPAIEALMARAELTYAQLDAIVFGRGPGSFTGLRTACAVAQGLAYGAGVPVLPVDTLLAVAEEARLLQPERPESLQVLALMDARMNEVYGARYRREPGAGGWVALEDCVLLSPVQVTVQASDLLAGNVFEVYGGQLPGFANAHCMAWPTARALLSLAPQLWAAGHAVGAAQALPLYVRDKVAQTTQEREAVRAAQAVLAAQAPRSAP